MSNILRGPPFLDKWSYKSIAELLYEKISIPGSSPAMICGESGEKLSYDQLFKKSLKLSLSLAKMDLRVNDRIGICSENNINYGIAVMSSIFLGATICPFNPLYTAEEFFHLLSISKPKYIFVSKIVLGKMQEIVKSLSWAPKLILLQEAPNSTKSSASNSRILNLPDLISSISDDELRNFKLPEIDKNEHVLVIACSSGTTGLPKGVMLTDKNFLVQIQYYENEEVGFLRNGGSFLGLLPMYHGYGILTLLINMNFGHRLVLMSRFEERLLLQTVQRYQIKTLPLVPPLMVFLAKSPIVDEFDLSCVKQILCAAAPLSKSIIQAVQKRFKLPFVRNGYGMTEITMSLFNSDNAKKPGGVGYLRNGIEAKVIPVDGNSKEGLGPNCEGELCFKGDLVMKGYCGDEKATRAVIDEDGFLHTGDVGYYDEEGYFFVVDRMKELIKYKAYQVPPAELEAILLTHSAIKDAAVVGLPDEIAGELPLAFVVKQPGVKITAPEIVKYVNDHVSSQKHLRGGVRFVEAIPKNSSGKILRRELRNILKSKI